MDPSLYWHDPFNRFPTWVYHFRHPDPELDMMVRVTPWDYIPEDWEWEDNLWDNDTSWMEEDGDGYPDPNDW